MSAEIIRFIRDPKRDRWHSDFPTIAFRSVARLDDLVMDHADMAACEHDPRHRDGKNDEAIP